MEVFKEYAQYYNALYKDKDYAFEAKTIQRLFQRYGMNGSHIVNFGCGTGRHDFELERLGYQCHGIDMSEGMIEEARNRANEMGSSIEFEVADIRDYKTNTKYDAVISLFHVMSYQNTNEDVMSTIKSARNCLDDGGLFVFDCWYGPGVLTDCPEIRVKEIEIDSGKVIRIAQPKMHPNENIVDVNYELLFVDGENKIRTLDETHSMRYFFEPEMKLMLECGGFDLIDVLDVNRLMETTFESWTAFFVARRS